MRTFVKNLIGGILIMVVATGIGVAQNAVRSKPITLVPRLPKKAGTAKTRVAKEVRKHDGERVAQRDVALGESDAMAVEEGLSVGGSTITDEEWAHGELSKERVKALLDANAFLLIDARSAHEFEKGHLPGAMNVPYEAFLDHYDRLLEMATFDQPILVYCTSYDCDLGEKLMREMQLAGYENILMYKGGWLEWSEAGYPVEGTGQDTQH